LEKRILGVRKGSLRALPLAFAMAGMFGTARAGEVPLPQPRPSATDRAAPASVPRGSSGESTCLQRLRIVAVVIPLPPIKGPGSCGGDDLVRLEAIELADKSRVAVTPPPKLRCEMAADLATWVREDVARRVNALGGSLRGIRNYDDYDCRSRNRIAGAKLSEHGKGNAIDIRALVLDDGRSINLSDAKLSTDFRKALRTSACARFTTVLGPGSDGFHSTHVHLDLLQRHHDYRICEWNIDGVVASTAASTIPLPLPRPPVSQAYSMSPTDL
jgi:hypothetical protein